MDKKKEKKICIDCEVKTNDYYPLTTNRGKIFRCVECQERWIRHSTRMDIIKPPQKEK